MGSNQDEKILQMQVANLNLTGYEKHIVICGGPKCCSEEVGEKAWAQLKKTLAKKDPDKKIFRTRAKCLRVCQQGPVAVVYPNGTWYGNLHSENLDKIIDCELLSDKEVQELCIAKNKKIQGK